MGLRESEFCVLKGMHGVTSGRWRPRPKRPRARSSRPAGDRSAVAAGPRGDDLADDGQHVGGVVDAVGRDCLAGTNGRAPVANWVPKWLAFPPAAYTERGGVGTVRTHALAVAAMTSEPDGAAPARPDPERRDPDAPQPTPLVAGADVTVDDGEAEAAEVATVPLAA